MRSQPVLTAIALGALALASTACGPGGKGLAALGAGAGGAALGPVFAGVGAAAPLSPTEVVVSWPAGFTPEAGPPLIKYRVYRAFDLASVLLESAFVHETQAGVTSFLDVGLPPYTVVYYRVVALGPSGRRSLSSKVATAFPPTTFLPGSVDYAAHVAPLWDTSSLALVTTCLTCHGTGGSASMKLDTWEGVVVGLGTPDIPDSFVVPFDGGATWNEFLARFLGSPLPHLDYIVDPGPVLAMEPMLKAWADQGALPFPDSTPPVFEFEDIDNAGKYKLSFPTFETVKVDWFDASDPESLPINGDNTGQLEYVIFAGTDPETIDWLNPVARDIYSPTTTATFSWPAGRIAVVVRALDAVGRANPWSPDPIASRLRRVNESVNARVLVASREAP